MVQSTRDVMCGDHTPFHAVPVLRDEGSLRVRQRVKHMQLDPFDVLGDFGVLLVVKLNTFQILPVRSDICRVLVIGWVVSKEFSPIQRGFQSVY